VPILASQTDIYPADLLDDRSLQCGERRWRAIHTRPRQEKALARELEQHQVSFFLPLVPKRSRVRGRVFESQIPLFAGYIFTFGDEFQRQQTLRTNRVVHSLDVQNQSQFFCELRNLRALIAADAPLTLERKLQPGRPVRIKSGPMQGIDGTIITRRGKELLLVAVTLLQQGVTVEIDDFQVEPLY
jgi:transcriptional antiterminator RfaH